MPKKSQNSKFHIEFLNTAQRTAWASFQQHDVLFMIGPAGCGKTILSVAFAINEILNKSKNRIILTRPAVESGEKLGFLPGDFDEKLNPYMMPFFDSMNQLIGVDNPLSEHIKNSLEIAPLAFMRGRSFRNSICILDEAQNATKAQLRMFMSRFCDNSKLIITGDPEQSDIPGHDFIDVVRRLETVAGIGIIEFKNESIVRHPLVGTILDRLRD